MMFARHISDAALTAASQNPVVTIMGPRQSGKTTLCRTLFPDHEYRSLEAPDMRSQALAQCPIRQEHERIVNQSLDRARQPGRLNNSEPLHFIQHPDDAVDINGLFHCDSSQSAVAGQEDCGFDLFGHSQSEAIVPSQRGIKAEIPLGLNESG